MMRGFSPVSSSNGEALVFGRPLVRLRMSTAVCDGVVPKRNGRAAGYQHRSCQFQYGSNGVFGDSVELMHVRRACRVVHSRLREEL
eukprot:6191121-Pleurochrysis_carterae.AAC.2